MSAPEQLGVDDLWALHQATGDIEVRNRLGTEPVGLLGGFVLGALAGVGLLVTKRVSRGGHIPHGPFMLVGAALALVAGEPLWQDYLSLVGLA